MLGYGAAWFSHFAIEKNRPATLDHPLLSLQADLVMWGKTLVGTMDDEVEQVLAMAEDEPAADAEIRPNVRADRTVN